MGPSKGNQDTNDGIVMTVRRKGYERPPPTTAISKSSTSSANSDGSSISCGNSTEQFSTSSANSGGSSITCGNSTEQNSPSSTLRNTSGSSTSSANSERSYAANPWERNIDQTRTLPWNIYRVRQPMDISTISPTGNTQWPNPPEENNQRYGQRLTGNTHRPNPPEENNQRYGPRLTGNAYRPNPLEVNDQRSRPRSPCCCSKRKAIGAAFVVIFLLSIVAVIVVQLTQNPGDAAACEFLNNEVICPFEKEYNRLDILSPPVYLTNGAGRTSFNLTYDTDITINGFNIRVEGKKIHIQKKLDKCPEQGVYPIVFSREDKTQSETKLPLKVKDFNDTMQMEIIPFTNTSDSKKYVQLTCTGYHQCGTVVMDLELKASDFGTYNTPMECSRTDIEGAVMDKYGYACTFIMSVEMFQRTENLTCKPTVESLQNAKTTPIEQQSIDVNETTQSHFNLTKGENTTIQWNVNIQTPKDIRHLQTQHNGDIHGNNSDLDDRVKLFTSAKGAIATCKVVFSPVTCIDEGQWQLYLLNSTQQKEIQVTGKSTITACPSLVRGNVSGKMELKFTLCVPDALRKYALNLYGKTDRRGSFLTKKSIEVIDQNTYFRAHLHLNELSVIYTKERITCHDHMTVFMMTLQTNGGDTIQNITSLTNVIVGRDRYKTYSTGGDFRENIPAVVSLRMHLGCRPRNVSIYINGSLLSSKYAFTEDPSTGEKLFSKSFSFPKMTMKDNATVVKLQGSFIDDVGSSRNLSITEVIRVIPDTFCQGRPHGCNYPHPYNSNLWIACGEGLIAEFGNCQSGLEFNPVNCEGKCL